MSFRAIMQEAGVPPAAAPAALGLQAHTPIDGSALTTVPIDGADAIAARIAAAHAAFLVWRAVPAPLRGELIRRFARRVRRDKQALGRLISLESGKILSEGLGEVQEVIDICDFAVGLSRQLYGLTIASERPGHHLLERWHPLGPVGVITAFNFPMAVWAWNAALALVCGNTVIWKPSEKTPLCALALHRIMSEVIGDFAAAHPAISQLVIGRREAGEQLADSEAIPLVSATGSTAMGRALGPRVAARFGRTLLELGGNNAAIVTPSADLALSLRAIVFAAAGTAGQRCTTLRRLIVHRSLATQLKGMLRKAYASLAVGSPLERDTLVGPLIDAAAFVRMQAALAAARQAGATVVGGDRIVPPGLDGGYYVRPALVESDSQFEAMREETFAPILYILPYDNFEEAMALQNGVRQGLSSAIFTTDMREAETFLSATGSDCGIANVNTGPSGAEIGGAFGGEKETGGGRESGSDSWKAYMRRQTQTVNYSSAVPLAQGVQFPVE
ncbi:MAG: aldehyde dehydrogenase family protein [Gammaproteobacteria bacterium]|nr:aldehyde dehydrogenase family protein [Gammaproteobacteria bacterium]MDE2250236.1 aldehyde dehydrogenase family protein [Gammaproteobacteria bacterium]